MSFSFISPCEIVNKQKSESFEKNADGFVDFMVAFPRDGKSRCPFVPGQRNFLVPVSLCPGTRAGENVPGQCPLSRDVPGQNHIPNRT